MNTNLVRESKVEPENFVNLQGWMVRELNLKGNELNIYAIIFGFSKEKNKTFHGSLRYLMDWTLSTKKTVIKTLKALENKGFIKKKEYFNNGVKLCEYYATKTRNEKSAPSAPGVVEIIHQGGVNDAPGVVEIIHQGGGNNTPGWCKNYTRGGVKITPNNIEDNINNNILRKKERKKERKEYLNDNSLFKRENKNEIKKISAEKNSTEKKKISFDEIIENYTQNEKLRTELKEHLRVRKAKRAALTVHALELSLKRLDSLANSENEKIEIVQNAIMSGWTTFYPLRSSYNINSYEKTMVKTNSVFSASNYNIDNYEKTMDVFDAQVKKEEERKKAKAEARAKVIELAKKEHEENVRKYDEKYAQELEECEDLEEYKSTKEYFNHLLEKGCLLDGTRPPDPKNPKPNLFESPEEEARIIEIALSGARRH